MVQHALTPEQSASHRSDATYGDLVERANRALARAATHPPDRFVDAEDARHELAGY
jgi:hypothetical protein